METEKQVLQIRIPENFSEYNGDEIMSNFDSEINEETALKIKGKTFYSRYSGWNFNGMVWWQAGSWHCEVWCYNSFEKTFTADTLREIMNSVCEEYGHE